jgi:hypothetical protein
MLYIHKKLVNMLNGERNKPKKQKEKQISSLQILIKKTDHKLASCKQVMSVYVLSGAINFGRQGHFKIWLDCHNFKKFPCLIMANKSTKCQKIEKKMTINVIQHDDRL